MDTLATLKEKYTNKGHSAEICLGTLLTLRVHNQKLTACRDCGNMICPWKKIQNVRLWSWLDHNWSTWNKIYIRCALRNIFFIFNQAWIALPSYRWTCWMLVSQVSIRRQHKGVRVHCWHSIQEVGSKQTNPAPTDIWLQPAMTGVSQKLLRQRGDNISDDLPTMVRTAWTWTRKYWPEPGKAQICHAKSGLGPIYTDSCEPQLSIQKACRVCFFLSSYNGNTLCSKVPAVCTPNFSFYHIPILLS